MTSDTEGRCSMRGAEPDGAATGDERGDMHEGGHAAGSGGRSRARYDRGVTLVLFALVLVSLLSITAIVIDLGNARQQRRQLQNSVDAAALAAASELGITDGCAGKFSKDYLFNNLRFAAPGSVPSCGAVNQGWSETFNGVEMEVTTPFSGVGSYSPSTLINVRACREVETTFGRLLGRDTVRVCAEATARKDDGTIGDGDDGDPDPGCDPKKKDACGITVPLTFNPACVQTPATTPVVDGRAGPGTRGTYAPEGYIRIGDLGLDGADYGDILYTCDSQYLYFAMKFNALALTGVANENVYGDLEDYHQLYSTGWDDEDEVPQGHTAKNTIDSEYGGFQLVCGTTVVHDFQQKYVSNPPEDGGKKGDGGGVPGTFVSQVKKLNAGTAPDRMSSSMVYNLNNPGLTGWSFVNAKISSPPFLGTYPVLGATYPEWEFSMLYEFRVPRAGFPSTCTATTIQVVSVHSSPPKLQGLNNIPGTAVVKVALVG